MIAAIKILSSVMSDFSVTRVVSVVWGLSLIDRSSEIIDNNDQSSTFSFNDVFSVMSIVSVRAFI